MTVENLNQTAEPQIEAGVIDATAAQDSDAAMEAAYERAHAQDDGQDSPVADKAAAGKQDKASLEGEAGAEEPEAGSTVAKDNSAPAHLPQAIKADWAKIPESARSAIVAHQAEMDRKFTEHGRQMALVKPVHDRLTQAVTEFPEFAGRTPAQLAQGAVELAAVQSRLERGGQGAIETLIEVAKTYNMLPVLAQYFGGNGGQAQSGDTAALQYELQALKSQFTPELLQQQVSQVLEHRNVVTEVNAFSSNADEAPFFADVADDIPYFIDRVIKASPGVSATDALKQAYDMAVNADPKVRQKVRDLEAQKATTSTVDPKRMDAAKKAAAININPAMNGRSREMTEEELYSQAYDRAHAS